VVVSWERLGASTLIVYGVVGLTTTSSSAASPQSEDRYRISFTAPARCPDRQRFLAQISARVAAERLSDEAVAGHEIHVALESRPEGFSARMEYVDADGQPVTRSLLAPNCAQATVAIALVTAMAIDSETEGLAAPNHEGASGPARRQPSPDPPGVVAPLPEADEPRATKPARGIRQEVAVMGGVRQGVGPGLAYGADLSWGGGGGAFPLVRVVLGWHETRASGDPSDPARSVAYFRVVSLGPELCWGEQFGETPVAAGLCLGGSIGEYRVERTSLIVENPFLWLEGYFSAPVRLMNENLFVELRPDLRFPFTREAFGYVDGVSAARFEVPRWALALNLGVGLTF
jgi:hypothetical protein